jgi:hypothetical protein
MTDLAKNLGSGVVGAVLTGLPLFVFLESRVEKRVTFEVRVAQLREGLKSTQAQLQKHEEQTRGSIWTLEQNVRGLEKEVAIKHSEP